MRKSTTLLALLLGAMALCALPVRGQSVSQSITIGTAGFVSGTAVTAALNNVGQSAHQAYVCISLDETDSSGSADIEMQSSSDGTNFSAISGLLDISVTQGGPDFGHACGVLVANGYYAYVRIAVYNATSNVQGGVNVYGTYQGSVGSNPVGGEVRTTSDAQKVSQIPTTSNYINAALLSTGVEVVTAATSPNSTGNFIYGVQVYNPNASTEVYVQLGANASPGTTPALLVPVAGGATVNLSLANPVFSAGSLYIACSTSPTSQVSPSTGCFAELLYITRLGSYSRVSAAGLVQNSDNSAGAIPH